jgi:branched-chain amino acid transport system permease protein
LDLLQLIVNGVALGAAYALVALGFVLILKATSAVNFAQGDMVMAGGFTAVAVAPLAPLAELGVPGLVLLPLVMVLMALFGVLFSLVAYFPLKSRPPVAVFISTIALGIILQNGATGIFGPAPRLAPPLVDGAPIVLGGLVISRQSLAIIAVAAILIVGLHLLFTRTQFGRRLRATAEDPEMARAIGIRVDRMIATTFALAAALAGAAGLLLANQHFVEPTSGFNLMIKAYIAVVIGGWGSIPGAVAGAFLIAMFEIIVAAWISSPVAEAGLYAALLLILALRPRGLIGEATGRRA